MSISSSWPGALRRGGSEVEDPDLPAPSSVHLCPEWELKHALWSLSVPGHRMDTSLRGDLMTRFLKAPYPILKVQEHLPMRSRVQIIIL